MRWTGDCQFTVKSMRFVFGRGLFLLFCFFFQASFVFGSTHHLIFDEDLKRTGEEFYFDLNESGELGKYRITGTRYGNPNGEPWLLCHGFLQTENSMLEYAKGLVEQGKNVYVINEVGFGLEGRRSLVRPGVKYQPGDYGFQGVVQGIAQAVANVSRTTGKKVVLLGFSMGAMASREYIEGTYGENGDGSPQRDEKLALARQNLLKHTILVGGPPDNLRGMNLQLKLASAFGYVGTSAVPLKTRGFVPLGLGTSAENSTVRSPLIRSVAVMKGLGLFSLVRMIFRDGGDLRNYGSKERIFDQILQYDFSNPHVDILESFARKSIEERELPPLVGSRGKMKLTIVGSDNDGFVSKFSHMDEFQSYYRSNPTQTRGVFVTDAGHLDLTGEVVLRERGLLDRLLERNDFSSEYDVHYEPFAVLGKPGLILKYQVRNFKEGLLQEKSQLGGRMPRALTCGKVHSY